MTVPIAVLGSGGHACDLIDLIGDINAESERFEFVGLYADWVANPQRLSDRGLDVVGSIESLRHEHPSIQIIIGLGYPSDRLLVSGNAALEGRAFATLIHPDARVVSPMLVGAGSVIAGGARLSGNVRLGEHVYVAQNSVIGHDTQVGSFSSVFAGSVLSGDVEIGSQVLIGSSACVRERLRVGEQSVLGAGAVLIDHLPAGETWIGVPARHQRRAVG